MRVVYYTRTCYLDSALPQAQALSRLVELHLLVEFSPESRFCNIIDWSPRSRPSGIVPGRDLFDEGLPAGAAAYLDNLAGVHVVNHTCPRSIHPSSWRVSAMAAELIRSLDPDVLHMDDLSMRMAPGLHLVGPTPIVMSIHDASAHYGEAEWRLTLARRLGFGRVSVFVLRNQSDVDTFNRHKADGAPVTAIPMGTLDIFKEWATPGLPEERFTVLFFGRLSPYKGLGVFCGAARRVAGRMPNVRFIAAGRPVKGYEPPRAPILAGRSEFELICGHVSNAGLAELFQRATLVVLPYLEATQSGVLLTAYAFGKPVVATAVGGFPEVVEDGQTGRLVAPGDERALAGAIVDLLGAPERREQMKTRIAERARTDLSWDSIAEQMAAVYESAAAGGGRVPGPGTVPSGRAA